MQMPLSFLRLRYFVAIAQHGHFGRAAQALGIAQSALSRHVLDLERSIGASLLDRTPKGAFLTPVGRVLFDEANRALAQLEKTYERARLAASGALGQLTIALNDLAERTPVATRAIAAFKAHHPEIDLVIRSMPSFEQITALRERRIDAGFLIERPPNVADLQALRLCDDPFVLVLRADHALAARDSIRLDDLRGEPFVTLSLQRFWLPQSRLLSACRAAAFLPRVAVEVESERLQVSLVAAGAGLALVNASTQSSLPPGILLRPIADLNASLSIDLVWQRDHASDLLATFVETLRSATIRA